MAPSTHRNPALPPPLPPETRTVGQLVAETLHLYGRRFWPSLAIGAGPAAAAVGLAAMPDEAELAWVLTVGSFLLTASYVAACALAADARPDRRTVAVALAAGMLVFVPVPFLYSLFVLPALAWLALFGLAVPAIVVERVALRASLRRSLQLARADYVHALGSLAALTIIVLLTASMLFFLLRGQGEATLTVAAFLAILVVSPVLALGAALLYFDQAARVVVSPTRTKRRPRRSDAHVSHADDADGAGRADAPVEPGPAARGEP